MKRLLAASILLFGIVAVATAQIPGSDALSIKLWDGTNTAAVKPASTAPAATDPALVVALSPNSAGIVTPPTPTTAIATGTTGAVTATLAAAVSVTNYICGFDISAIGGTATIGPITVTGLLNGTFTYQFASTATGVTLNRTYTPCVPASSTNVAIAVVTTADASASAVDVNVWGYKQ